jgi:DNA-binding IclR family transcriptional regulator
MVRIDKKALAKKLGVSYPTIYRNLKEMIDVNILKRSSDPHLYWINPKVLV